MLAPKALRWKVNNSSNQEEFGYKQKNLGTGQLEVHIISRDAPSKGTRLTILNVIKERKGKKHSKI